MKKKLIMTLAIVVIAATLCAMFVGCTGVGTYVLDAGVLGKGTIELKMGGKAQLDLELTSGLSYKGEANWSAGEKDKDGNVVINITYQNDKDEKVEFPVAYINEDGDLIVAAVLTFKKK